MSFKRRQKLQNSVKHATYLLNQNKSLIDLTPVFLFLYLLKNTFIRQRNQQFMLKTEEIMTENYQFNIP